MTSIREIKPVVLPIFLQPAQIADLDKVYLVPIDQVGRTRAHLRIEPAKNNQEKNVRWAKDYEF